MSYGCNKILRHIIHAYIYTLVGISAFIYAHKYKIIINEYHDKTVKTKNIISGAALQEIFTNLILIFIH